MDIPYFYRRSVGISLKQNKENPNDLSAEKNFPAEKTEFLTEKIKLKPVNRAKLIRRTLTTASMAVIFGLIACVTFLVLKPVISRWLYPEAEPEHVLFPEDSDEMSPEEMLVGDNSEESFSPSPTPSQDNVELEKEQIEEILSSVVLDLENYKELYRAISEYVNSLSRYMVMVTAVKSNRDWFNDIQESTNQCSGLILQDNGKELLVLTNYSAVQSAEKLLLTFYDDSQVEAQIKQYNVATDLAVLSVALAELPFELSEEEPLMAPLGTSNIKNLTGVPVVAVGGPMGNYGSMGHGVITSSGTQISVSDRNYKLLTTDISGSRNANGMLFNLQGQVIGVITNAKTDADMNNMICAYGITELKKIIENMSNDVKTPYLGIRGVDVSKEAHQELEVPFGAFIREIDFDSPAMHAGLQQGDIIVSINDKVVTNFSYYSNALMQLQPGQTVNIKVMRMVRNEYKEMSFHVELKEAKNE